MKDPSVWNASPLYRVPVQGPRQERPESSPAPEYQGFSGRAGRHEASPYLLPALRCRQGSQEPVGGFGSMQARTCFISGTTVYSSPTAGYLLHPA